MLKNEPEQDKTLHALAQNIQTILRCLAFGANVKTRPMLTVTQMRVLSYFNDQDVIHVSDISRRLDMSIQSVNNRISRLEATGYVQRSPNIHDRRLTDVRLTDSGRDSLASFQQFHMQHMQALLRGLTAMERRNLSVSIDAAARILEEAEKQYADDAKADESAFA